MWLLPPPGHLARGALLFRHGEYTAEDALTTANTLRFMVPFLLAVAGINIIKKVYFALEDRRTLLVRIGTHEVRLR